MAELNLYLPLVTLLSRLSWDVIHYEALSISIGRHTTTGHYLAIKYGIIR